MLPFGMIYTTCEKCDEFASTRPSLATFKQKIWLAIMLNHFSWLLKNYFNKKQLNATIILKKVLKQDTAGFVVLDEAH